MVVKHSGYILITLLIFAALIGSVFVQPSPASAAATWYVDKAGTDDPAHGTGPGANAFLTINYAISRAGAGDTINIGLGTWVEQVIINKPLTLLGTAVAPSPGGTFIAAPADGSRTNYTAGDGTVFDYVIVAHDTTNVIVSTLTVYAAGARKAGADYYATVVFDNVDNDNLIGFDSGCVSGAFNNNIADIDIAIWEDSFIAVENSLLVDFVRSGVECNGGLVRVRNNEINAEVPAAACVSLDHADAGVLIDNLLLSVGNGVVAADSRTVNIVGNELHGTAALNGIQFQMVEHPFIQKNTIYGFQAGVIDLGTTAVGYIAGNEIFDCADGIALNSATSTWESVYDNLIYDNGRGLYHASQLNDVTGNILYHNTTGIESANAITAHCNAIFGNTGSGLNLAADGTFNVTNNYWGANSGPNVNGAGPGTGDNILTHGHTLPPIFNPWAAMTLSATPNSIVADGAPTSTIDLDCTHNSAGQVMGCVIPDGMQVLFTTTAGTFTSNTALTSGGHAVTSLHPGAVAGIATVGSSFSAAPGLTLSTTQVTFTAPPPLNPPEQAGINAGPGSHGSSMTTTVTTQGPQSLPNVQVSSARLSAPSIATGSPVTVTADVTNTGTANGTAVVKVYLNDEPAATQGVNVARGSTVPMTFTIAPSQPGEYTVRVNNVQAGSLKVKDYNESDIVFAAALAAFILLVTSLLIVYLRRSRAAVS